MQIKSIQNTIAKTALAWVRPTNLCKETTKNRGICIDTIKCYYYTGKFDCPTSSLGSEAYCAIFVMTALLKAFESAGLSLDLLKSIKTAGAKQLLVNAKNKAIPTSKTPEIGSVFYRRSGDPTASGHVGIVVGIDNDKKLFYIVDGNNSIQTIVNGKKVSNGEGVWLHTHTFAEIQSKGFEFIHIHQVVNSSQVNYTFTNPLNGEVVNGGSFGGDGVGFGLGSILLMGGAMLATLFGLGYYNYSKQGKRKLLK